MKPTKEKTMEAIYLQSSLQFGETLKSVSDSDYRRLRDNYDALLKQPLQLRFFVPCDENGNVLEEPKRWNDYLQFPDSFDGNKEWGELYNYELAKERVLFNGFVFEESQKEALKNNTQLSVSIYTENSFYITHRLNGKWHTWFSLKTVEDLIKCKIELSKTAIKQIGL